MCPAHSLLQSERLFPLACDLIKFARKDPSQERRFLLHPFSLLPRPLLPLCMQSFFLSLFSTRSVCLPLFLFLEMEIRGGKREEEKRGMKFLRLYLSYFGEEIPGTPFFSTASNAS